MNRRTPNSAGQAHAAGACFWVVHGVALRGTTLERFAFLIVQDRRRLSFTLRLLGATRDQRLRFPQGHLNHAPNDGAILIAYKRSVG